jgi:RNA polymerase sigma-70 factor, ECF subfamily
VLGQAPRDPVLQHSSQLEVRPSPSTGVSTVGEIYAEHAKFVWRNLRRLGVPASGVEDAVQDVFLVIHRQLPEFAGRSSLRTWIFGIVLRVASRQRERFRNNQQRFTSVPSDLLDVIGAKDQGPLDLLIKRRAADLVYGVLDEMDEEKRTILVMVELEQMSVVEAAEILEIKVNTAYTRLRLARITLEAHVKRVLGESREEP